LDVIIKAQGSQEVETWNLDIVCTNAHGAGCCGAADAEVHHQIFM
jgi:hypothetical protein